MTPSQQTKEGRQEIVGSLYFYTRKSVGFGLENMRMLRAD